MLSFLTGDELGNVKRILYPSTGPENDRKITLSTVHNGLQNSCSKEKAIQRLALTAPQGKSRLVSGHANGSISLFSLQQDDPLTLLTEWRESRFHQGHSFVGLAGDARSVYSCTSNGGLRRTSTKEDHNDLEHELVALPMRISEWHLSASEETFSYGGDEVDLSLWSVEKAFSSVPTSQGSSDDKKRKRNNELFPGEIWRAKNLPNDHLGLRQPIHITSLTYFGACANAVDHHIITGTRFGDVRRYDTRAAHRPVADWRGIGKVGGVRTVVKGVSEHEICVADNGSHLYSLDARNGRISYAYKGIAGAVTSVAVAPLFLLSTSLDRFARIHSTHPPPSEPGGQQERKGQILSKVFTKSIPTTAVWDTTFSPNQARDGDGAEGSNVDNDEDLWNQLEHVGTSDDDRKSGKKRKIRQVS